MDSILLRLAFSFVIPSLLTGMPGAHASSGTNIPAFQGDLLDEAQVLSSSQEEELRKEIARLRTQDDVWLAVHLPAKIQGTTIESFANDVFQKWKLGEKGKDNDLLLIVAPNERKMRIEVGYGLEELFTDSQTKRLQETILKPYMKSGRYFEGIQEAIRQFSVMAAKHEPSGTDTLQDQENPSKILAELREERVRSSNKKEEETALYNLLFWLLCLLYFFGFVISVIRKLAWHGKIHVFGDSNLICLYQSSCPRRMGMA
ncbi:MAG: TPM domain-containing protein [Bdellovibrionales bacterium]|nr:TPM domain-containing protein [Bdellovibrionales bacterium]